MFLLHFYRYIAFLSFILTANMVMGQCVSVMNGDWDDVDTWSCGDLAVQRVPVCTDVPITIAVGDIVDISNLQDYSGCGNPVVIFVEGDFNFASNGPKLKLPAGSYIGGNGNITFTQVPGAGNANFIDIGGQTVWEKDDGPVFGPFQFPESHPLPVHLLSFDGSVKVDGVYFNWVVASEVNNDYFTIERSPDMVNWSVVHEQSGHGTSNQIRTYYGHDARPENRLVYYRLSQTDFDGSRESFDPIAINKGHDGSKEQHPILFPNPLDLSGQHDLFVENSNDDIVQITILDLNGNSVQEIGQNEISDNSGRIEIDNQTLSSGMYLVKIEGISWVRSEKLFVY